MCVRTCQTIGMVHFAYLISHKWSFCSLYLKFILRAVMSLFKSCPTAVKIKDREWLCNSFVYVTEGKAAL